MQFISSQRDPDMLKLDREDSTSIYSTVVMRSRRQENPRIHLLTASLIHDLTVYHDSCQPSPRLSQHLYQNDEMESLHVTPVHDDTASCSGTSIPSRFSSYVGEVTPFISSRINMKDCLMIVYFAKTVSTPEPWPPAEKTGKASLLNRPSCNVAPTTQSAKGLNWTELSLQRWRSWLADTLKCAHNS